MSRPDDALSEPSGSDDAPAPDEAASAPATAELAGVLDLIEAYLLDEAPTYTREQVAVEAGVPLAVAMQLWRLSGFPHAEEGEVAFTKADVTALRLTHDLMQLGVLSDDRQAALVRTWGRSFARLAEWQTSLLADVALERGGDAGEGLMELAGEVLPRVEALQTYIWRRHLVSAAARLLSVGATGNVVAPMGVGFCDIVGYTARSKELNEAELVDWIEGFEDAMTAMVADAGGRVIKSLGDAVLWVCDTAPAAAHVALAAVTRGEAEDDPFPQVRAGIAYGEVVLRLGDVFGPTVNIASRLTSLARPGTVLADEGVAAGLEESGLHLRKLRRVSVKGYSRLQPYVVRPGSDSLQ